MLHFEFHSEKVKFFRITLGANELFDANWCKIDDIDIDDVDIDDIDDIPIPYSWGSQLLYL